MKIQQLLAIVIVAALGFWGYTIFFPSPEKVIKETLQRLADTASFTSQEKPLARLGAINAIPSFFQTNAVLRISNPRYGRSLEGRAAIREAVAGSRAAVQSLQITLTDPQITVTSSEMASLVVTATVFIDQDPNPSLQILKMKLQRQGRKWLITYVEPIDLDDF